MVNADTYLPMHACMGIATYLLVYTYQQSLKAAADTQAQLVKCLKLGRGKPQLQVDATARADRACT